MLAYKHQKTLRRLLTLLLFLPLNANANISVSSSNNWQGVFAGEVTPYKFNLLGSTGRIFFDWKLTVKGRTLSSGSQNIHAIQNKPKTITIALGAPRLKAGVVQEAVLLINAQSQEEDSVNIEKQFKIMIYGAKPLLSQAARLSALDIKLYDPIGNTLTVFDEINVPYTEISKSELINNQFSGLVVIGDSTNIVGHRGLNEILLQTARTGSKYLILNPSSISIPLSDTIIGSPPTIELKNNPVGSVFAKNFQWIDDKRDHLYGIELASHRGVVLADVSSSNAVVWDWLQLHYNDTNGSIVLITLPIVDQLVSAPIPQIIFGHLLTHVSNL